MANTQQAEIDANSILNRMSGKIAELIKALSVSEEEADYWKEKYLNELGSKDKTTNVKKNPPADE